MLIPGKGSLYLTKMNHLSRPFLCKGECLSVDPSISLTEIVVHAEVRHELLEDVKRIVKMKGSIEKVFGEARITAVRRMTRVAVIIRQASSTQLIIFATFVF